MRLNDILKSQKFASLIFAVFAIPFLRAFTLLVFSIRTSNFSFGGAGCF